MKIKHRYFILGVGILCVLMIAIVIGSNINKKVQMYLSQKRKQLQRNIQWINKVRAKKR